MKYSKKFYFSSILVAILCFIFIPSLAIAGYVPPPDPPPPPPPPPPPEYQAETNSYILRLFQNIGSLQWESSDYSYIDDYVVQPKSPDIYDNVESRQDGVWRNDYFDVTPIPASIDTVYQIKLWAYVGFNEGRRATAKMKLNLYALGWLGEHTIQDCYGWVCITYTNLNIPGDTTLILSAKAYTSGDMAATVLSAAYVEVFELGIPNLLVATTISWHDSESHILWEEVEGAESYEVYYKYSDQQEFSFLAETTNNFYDWQCFTDGVYTVKVRACRKSHDPDIISPFSSEKAFLASYPDPWNVVLTETFDPSPRHLYEVSWDGPSQLDLDHVDYQVQRRYYDIWIHVIYTQEEFTAWYCDGLFHTNDCDQVRVRLIWRQDRQLLPITINLLKASAWAYSNTV